MTTIIPTPDRTHRQDGSFCVTNYTSVVADSAGLLPICSILTNAIKVLTDLKLAVSLEPLAETDWGIISLKIDGSLKEEEYKLTVADERVVVFGGSYSAVANAAASLSQIIRVNKDRVEIPCLTICDHPAFFFRALMVDLARYRHSMTTIKQLIVLCWWYKIRYLQLHLTDIQAFTFPSSAYPELSSEHNRFTTKELCELEDFSLRHGVAIIPEIDIPGHANSALRTLCPTDPHNDWNLINPAHPNTLPVLDTLIGEFCDVFRSSPFIHIGGDEVVFKGWADCAICRKYLRKKNLSGFDELFNHFLSEASALVRKHGKRPMMWEGFKLDTSVEVPKDVVVQCYELLFSQPEDLIAAGYEIVNASWGPLYVTGKHSCPTAMIHQWNPQVFGSHSLKKVPDALKRLAEIEIINKTTTIYPDEINFNNPPYVKAIPPSSSLLGGMLCSWQLPDCVELPNIRRRLAAMSERAWNPGLVSDFSEFLLRLECQDETLQLLLEDILRKNTGVFNLISRAQEMEARLQAGQTVGIGADAAGELAVQNQNAKHGGENLQGQTNNQVI